MANPAPAVQFDGVQFQQFMQALANQGGGRKRLSPFSSADPNDWLAFRRHFIATAALNDWNNQRQVQQLNAALEGEACRRAAGINLAGNNPTTGAPWRIAEALDALEGRYLPPGASRLAASLYEQARQLEDESVIEWHGRLRNLFDRAHPGDPINNNRHCIKKFIMGLNNRELIKDILTADPQTYEACYATATERAAILYSLEKAGVTPRTRIASTDVSGAGVLSIEDGSGSSGESGRTPVCWDCGEPGHVRNNCPRRRPASRPPTRGPQQGRPAAGRGRGRSAPSGGGRNTPGPKKSSDRAIMAIASVLKDLVLEPGQGAGDSPSSPSTASGNGQGRE